MLVSSGAALKCGADFSVPLPLLHLHSDDPSKAQELSCNPQPFRYLEMLLRPTLLLFAPKKNPTASCAKPGGKAVLELTHTSYVPQSFAWA